LNSGLHFLDCHLSDYMHIDDEPTGAAEAQSTTCADRDQMVRRSSSSAATNREGRCQQKSDRASQHRE
jgi:hypothetical protein